MAAMKVSVGVGRYAIHDWDELSTFAKESERLGIDSLWTAEAWAHDGATPLAFLMAQTSTIRFGTGILQVGTRTPALVAMTAMTLDSMSNGRFILGLGTSGPQVIEGWHGIPFVKPLQHTREVIEVCRRVFNGETLAYEGEFYHIPLDAEHGGSGEGKALRSEAPITPDLPIYIASLGPRNLRLTGELADGWIGTSFIPETADQFLDPIREGAEAAGRSLDDIDIGVGGSVVFTDDVEEAAQEFRSAVAFQLGAMGSRLHNFYNAAFSRQGWADEAKEIQRLWLDGQRDEARARVPLEMITSSNLIGTPDMVKERLRLYRDAGVNTFRAGTRGQSLEQRLDTLGQLMDLVREVNAE